MNDEDVRSEPQPAPLTEVAQQSRRVRIPAAIVAVLSLVVASLLGAPLIGAGVCLGLAFGGLNAQLLQASMVRFTDAAANRRKQFVLGGFARLGAITVVTLVLVSLIRPLGWGILGGLAGYQMLLLGFAAAAMYKQVRRV